MEKFTRQVLKINKKVSIANNFRMSFTIKVVFAHSTTLDERKKQKRKPFMFQIVSAMKIQIDQGTFS